MKAIHKALSDGYRDGEEPGRIKRPVLPVILMKSRRGSGRWRQEERNGGEERMVDVPQKANVNWLFFIQEARRRQPLHSS